MLSKGLLLVGGFTLVLTTIFVFVGIPAGISTQVYPGVMGTYGSEYVTSLTFFGQQIATSTNGFDNSSMFLFPAMLINAVFDYADCGLCDVWSS